MGRVKLQARRSIATLVATISILACWAPAAHAEVDPRSVHGNACITVTSASVGSAALSAFGFATFDCPVGINGSIQYDYAIVVCIQVQQPFGWLTLASTCRVNWNRATAKGWYGYANNAGPCWYGLIYRAHVQGYEFQDGALVGQTVGDSYRTRCTGGR